MNTAIEEMLKNYHVENLYDRKTAMKEIMQEIISLFRKNPCSSLPGLAESS